MISGCPIEVDTKVEEVSLTSSQVVSDESILSPCNPYLVEPMYWFAKR